MPSIQINTSTESDISNLPYIDRQLVAISDTKTIVDILYDYTNNLILTPIEMIREAGNQNLINKIDNFQKSPIAINASKIIHSLRNRSKTLSTSKLSSDIAVSVLTPIINLNNKASVLTISQAQADKLSFPPGHPRKKIVYAGHPADTNTYYPISDFHRRVFEHKFSEAISLLTSLGATKIKVERVSGWSRSFSSKLSTPISQSVGQTDFAGDHSSKNESSILFEASFPGNNKPSIPDNLVWFKHESSWIYIANARMNHGLEDFSLSVHYKDDLGINASLGIDITKAKFNLGGNFEGHESTTWKLEGKFLPGAVSKL